MMYVVYYKDHIYHLLMNLKHKFLLIFVIGWCSIVSNVYSKL